MDRKAIDAMLETIRRLPAQERIAIADEVDRLAWRDRVQVVLDSVAASSGAEGGTPSEEEIDAIVSDVRSEKSLYERYWTLRRSSAA